MAELRSYLVLRNAALTDSQIVWIRRTLKSYPFVAQLKENLRPEWTAKNLGAYAVTKEDCMGNDYETTSQLWACLDTSSGPLYFFASRDDYLCVVAAFECNATPFDTHFEVECRQEVVA